ncbi:hypothetical protein NWQ34_04960 [Mycoplasmopsis felis]|uniref:hypothetical protein n=1 Tax=Mycoplasmopsis felis TaxID=33923 RepID=UPI0021E00E80|nr:hypothetical protein [Mycoplasmopsis felis]MCU9938928.1 hypothetical protein [Mycoplasmopsis felis]
MIKFISNNYYAQEIAQIPVSKHSFQGTSRLKNSYALELHCSGTGIETKAKFLGLNKSAKEIFELSKTNEIAEEIVNQAKDTLRDIFAISAGILAPHNYFIGWKFRFSTKRNG